MSRDYLAMEMTKVIHEKKCLDVFRGLKCTCPLSVWKPDLELARELVVLVPEAATGPEAPPEAPKDQEMSPEQLRVFKIAVEELNKASGLYFTPSTRSWVFRFEEGSVLACYFSQEKMAAVQITRQAWTAWSSIPSQIREVRGTWEVTE